MSSIIDLGTLRTVPYSIIGRMNDLYAITLVGSRHPYAFIPLDRNQFAVLIIACILYLCIFIHATPFGVISTPKYLNMSTVGIVSS